MSYLLSALQKKEAELTKLLYKVDHSLESAPEGRLRINHSKGKVQYYHRIAGADDTPAQKKNGHFIRKKDYNLAKKLAQKMYDEKMQKIVSKELSDIQRLLDTYDPEKVKKVYTELEEERKKLVDPLVISDEKYIEMWKNTENNSRNDYPIIGDIYTERGEHVRSKSEKILADKFGMLGIPYKYEQELQLKNGVKIYPDFTLLNVRMRQEIYYEHFGMMDDPEYVEKAVKKIALYEKNGFWLGRKLLCSFETKDMPLDIRRVEEKLTEYILRTPSRLSAR